MAPSPARSLTPGRTSAPSCWPPALTSSTVSSTRTATPTIPTASRLRAFWQNTKRLVDVYADEPTHERLLQAFGYCFKTAPGGFYTADPQTPPYVSRSQLNHRRGAGGPLTLTPFRQIHGDTESLGLRAGTMAYSCDVSDLPEATVPMLSDLDSEITNWRAGYVVAGTDGVRSKGARRARPAVSGQDGAAFHDAGRDVALAAAPDDVLTLRGGKAAAPGPCWFRTAVVGTGSTPGTAAGICLIMPR